MSNEKKQAPRHKILIVDDSELNRAILADMLGDEYDIIEAEDGWQAVETLQKGIGISLVLLDIVMPNMNGFEVLDIMNKNHWIEDIPVIMISTENGSSHVERAYELGVTDFIGRPFDALIVHRRVVNTILLYSKQKKLMSMMADQIYEKEKQSSLMIDILSHIVEFRNGESGLHVRNVRLLTELLLKRLVQKTGRYQISRGDISIISTASALHDIGKVAIPEEVLNKPGKLTNEEFALMKTHAEIGARMLEDLPFYSDEPLVKAAYEICRWHHERFDGRGYPDGLAGDAIPISAQMVALADVYDALTSERVYKKAIPHEEAVQMILEGKCGVFNPVVLECLTDIADTLQQELHNNRAAQNDRDIRSIAEELFRHEELGASERAVQLLEHERTKYNFFAALTQEIQFEYNLSPSMVTISAWGADKLGLPEVVMDPYSDKRVEQIFGKSLRGLSDALRSTTPEQPMVSYDCKVCLGGEDRWMRIISRATWSTDEPPRYMGAIGKAMDIHEAHMKLAELEQAAAHDPLTGLFNHARAKKIIRERMENRPNGQFALAILDLDYFKNANDNYGHIFGDHVLIHMAEQLRKCIRGGDIPARVGGDEFLIFLEYKGEAEPVIQRIFTSLLGKYEDFTISVSMGVARTADVGNDYEELFHAADQALYAVKRGGRGHFRLYDPSMKEMLSVISPMDSETGESDADDAPSEEEEQA